ncbi:MAG: ABC-F family ATP-binding cassette domain-containing protein [Phycisphaeraceae bacterium]|nr:ABC-F family ATP-binding cassette domain-containing protein [Phycisphaeraceae bacterium]
MPLLSVTNIRKAYGTRVILEGVSMSLEAGERIGLVGRNGQGKSTLLRIMGGVDRPDQGEVALAKGRRAGYLHQDPKLDPDETLRGAAEGAFAELHELHRRLNALYDAMGDADGPAMDRLLMQQADLEKGIEALGGYAIDHKVDAALHGVGFEDAQFPIKVAKLSGGQKGRLALARLLLEEPDILLLDEPTNHLDIRARLWLEDFLRNEFKGAVVIVSHDRRLLDHVVTRIVEVEHARLIDYPGNYAKFRELREYRRLTQLREFEKQQTRFKQEEEFIRKYKAGQRAKQAQGRLSRLDREKEGALERPMDIGEMRLNLPPAPRSGDMVVSARGLSKQYTNEEGLRKVLFNDLDLSITRGERWAILGPNGAGKTTLVRTLLGEVKPDAGTSRLGASLRVGYFTQEHSHLPMDMPIFRYLQRIVQDENQGKEMSEQQARDLAGAFLFSGGEQERPLGELSGGERSRAVLAGLLASAKNLLILDEPTNHLDIPSAERLEEVLSSEGGYEGTLILITHDRALMDAVCDRLIVLDGAGNAEIFTGNYSEWERKRSERERSKNAEEDAKRAERERQEKARRAAEEAKAAADRAKAAQKQAPKSNADAVWVTLKGRRHRLDRITVQEIEALIEEHETRIRAIDALLADPTVWKDPAKGNALTVERDGHAAALEPLEMEWGRRAEVG